jgi:CobQ/CobB/MinD/ParA nucleotide binding domain
LTSHPTGNELQPTAAGHFAPQPFISLKGLDLTREPHMPIITVHATKGGQGVTTITAALGTLHAQAGRRTLLIDTGGDLPAILGKPEPLCVRLSDYLINPNITVDDITVNIDENLDIVTRGTGPIAFTTYTYGLIAGGLGAYDTVIIDAGTSADEWNQHADRNVFVTRPCYLAVRRAIHIPRRPTQVVCMAEPGRALSAHDIEVVLGVPITATVPVDIDTARIIDAGILVNRMPQHLARALAPLVDATSSVSNAVAS